MADESGNCMLLAACNFKLLLGFVSQINVVQLQLLEAGLQCTLDIVHVRFVDFSSDEQLLP